MILNIYGNKFAFENLLKKKKNKIFWMLWTLFQDIYLCIQNIVCFQDSLKLKLRV